MRLHTDELDAPTARAVHTLADMPIPEPADRYITAFHHIVATLRRQSQRLRECEGAARDEAGNESKAD